MMIEKKSSQNHNFSLYPSVSLSLSEGGVETETTPLPLGVNNVKILEKKVTLG